MNLSGKYLNCRIKMCIGAAVGSAGSIIHLLGYFTKLIEPFPIAFFFSYFFALMGVVFLFIDLAAAGQAGRVVGAVLFWLARPRRRDGGPPGSPGDVPER